MATKWNEVDVLDFIQNIQSKIEMIRRAISDDS